MACPRGGEKSVQRSSSGRVQERRPPVLPPESRVDGGPFAIWYRYRYHRFLARIAKTVEAMRNAPHAVFQTPWAGDPRVNIQKSKGGEAKPYQVRQVLKAIDKLKEEQE